MRRIRVIIPWETGLHLRPAAELVRLARKFKSSVCLKANERVADVRSIMSIILLCATMGTALEIEANGEDEEIALSTLEAVFTPGENQPEAIGEDGDDGEQLVR